jgi:hypothetical protein
MQWKIRGELRTHVCAVLHPFLLHRLNFQLRNQNAWTTYPRGQVEATATMRDENWMDRKHFSIQFWFLS